MTAHFASIAIALLLLLPLCALCLEARVQEVDGIPTLMVNGEPMAPFLFLHTAGGGASPMRCKVGPEWKQFGFSFTMPEDDDNCAVHIRNVTPVGDWFVDDVRLQEGTAQGPVPGNLIAGGDFEGDRLPEAWTYFLNDSAGARANYSLETANPQEGRSCLRVSIDSPGQQIYEIHLYQRLALQRNRTYTFSCWLRSEQEREIEVQVIHQGPPWTIYGGDNSPSDELLRLGAERGLNFGTPPMDVPWPRDGAAPDYTAVDAQMRHILSVNPNALVLPRLHLDAPAWWKEAHPDQQQLYDTGPMPMSSPASELWRRDASEALRLIVRHLEADFGEHVPGYHVTAQSAGEWFYDHTWERIMPCFEEPFREAFARWAQGRYGTVDALCEAWRQPEVTFDTIRVPTVQERTTGALGEFRDPVAQRFEIDFARFMQECMCDYLEQTARIVKEETGGRKLGVFFYGYLYEVSGFAYGPAVSGHLRLRRLLDCPDVDIICSPISYNDRGAGGVGPFMSPCDSIQAHGKLWLNEDDARTHLADPSAGYGRTEDMRETLGVYRRNFGHQFERHCATWWMDFGTGWMADPTIYDNFARTRDIWQERKAPAKFSPEVAIITDEDSFFCLRNGNAITAPSISGIRLQFNRMGCPVGLYLMEDVCDGLLPDGVRFLVFLNAYRVTDEQLVALRRATAGKSALWMYAPGYVNEDASVDNIRRLLGFQVVWAPEGTAARVAVSQDAPAPLQGLAGSAFGSAGQVTPLFSVAPGQEGVVSLGTFEGTEHVALAMRKEAAGTTVFCGGLDVSADAFRELARDAGVHIYCESNDVISARPGFVTIHASEAGQKTLHFPEPVALQDLYSGEKLAAAREHSFAMERGDTRVFGY